jgi:hypothetical protein
MKKMSLTTIERNAQYMKDHYVDELGRIKEFDIWEGILLVNKENFNVNETNEKIVYERLGIAQAMNNLLKFRVSPQLSEEKGLMETINEPLDLMQKIVNFAIKRQKSDSRIIYDELNGDLKGIVSDGYRRVYNADVLDVAKEAFGTEIDERFSFINDKVMRVFFKTKREEMTPLTHEKIRYGKLVGNGEVGDSSLFLSDGIWFMRCTNGMLLDEIEFRESRVHVRDDLLQWFMIMLEKALKESKIAQLVDKWASRPAIMNREEASSEDGVVKLDRLLKRYGITKESYRTAIQKTLLENQEEEHKINGYWIGNAVNYFASNQVFDPTESVSLAKASYQIMTMY